MQSNQVKLDTIVHRVDGAAALTVLGEASKYNLSTLKILQSLAGGLIPTYITTEDDMMNTALVHEHKVNPHHTGLSPLLMNRLHDLLIE